MMNECINLVRKIGEEMHHYVFLMEQIFSIQLYYCCSSRLGYSTGTGNLSRDSSLLLLVACASFMFLD